METRPPGPHGPCAVFLRGRRAWTYFVRSRLRSENTRDPNSHCLAPGETIRLFRGFKVQYFQYPMTKRTGASPLLLLDCRTRYLSPLGRTHVTPMSGPSLREGEPSHHTGGLRSSATSLLVKSCKRGEHQNWGHPCQKPVSRVWKQSFRGLWSTLRTLFLFCSPDPMSGISSSWETTEDLI